MKIIPSLIVVSTVAMTGCVNWNSFNATNPSQAPTAPRTAATPAASANPSPTPAAKAKAKPTPAPAKAPAKPAATTTQSSTSTPAPTPKPTPSSQVIKEEKTSEVKVITSRPVVGTDAEMGN